VSIRNNDYPLGHFKEIFYEWMLQSMGCGTIQASETVDGSFEYTMSWDEIKQSSTGEAGNPQEELYR
jgi:hypothetical protein